MYLHHMTGRTTMSECCTITEKDRKLAQQCVECPVCSRARRKQKGIRVYVRTFSRGRHMSVLQGIRKGIRPEKRMNRSPSNIQGCISDQRPIPAIECERFTAPKQSRTGSLTLRSNQPVSTYDFKCIYTHIQPRDTSHEIVNHAKMT